jgi:GH25 family lysozyme M1 (1,4-beta-N-acetylmuramidase)
MQVDGRLVVPGIDVSNHQRDIDFAAVRDDGIRFAIAKATEGVGYIDPYFGRNREGFNGVGIKFAAYHWLKPNQPWGAQADVFLRVTGGGDGCSFVMLDAEENGISDDQVVNWCDRVADQTGKRVVIYCGTWTDPKERSDRWLKYTPCLAAYPSRVINPDPEVLKVPRGPAPWGFWTMWQYTSSGRVAGINTGNVDRDVLDARWFANLEDEHPPAVMEDKMIALVLGPDGIGIEFRARPDDGVVVLRWQGSPGGGWSDWALVNAKQPGSFDNVSAFVNKDGRCEVIAWHSSYKVPFRCWQVAKSGAWSDWAAA